MATKQKLTVRPATSSYEQATFVQRELTAEEGQKCKAWELSEVDAFDALFKLTEAYYKVTMRFDEYHHMFGCWLMPPKTDSSNAGLILTGRGSTPLKALKQALYKHYVLFQEVWPKERDERGEYEIDD